MGGEAAVPGGVEAELTSLGFSVSRISGQNRYETAALTAQRLKEAGAGISEAMLCSGENYPDALSASPAAAMKGMPILFSGKTVLEQHTRDVLLQLNIKTVYITGGAAAIGESVEQELKSMGIDIVRLWGEDRYQTSEAVAQRFFADPDCIFLASGSDFPDALVGAVPAGLAEAPVLLADGSISSYLQGCNYAQGYVLGGEMAVSAAHEALIRK